jgi:LytR cell envelope-related transcriptional attenuator
MDLIEDIGPILGIVAFLGFAILALLIVLQAREVRRLREWAGRAPERAREADEADRAAADARGEVIEEEERGRPGRIGAFRERIATAVGPRWAALDRRSPVDPRWFLVALLAGLIAVGVVTSGFGLIGDDEPAASEEGPRAGKGGGGDGGGQDRDQQPTVTVLNATQIDDPVAPVPAVTGIADDVADQIIEPAGFEVDERANAPSGVPQSVIMFAPEAEETAQELADAVEPDLGPTEVVPITEEITAVSRGADIVLLIGQDDDEFGQATALVQ